jgi:hypothetical protein
VVGRYCYQSANCAACDFYLVRGRSLSLKETSLKLTKNDDTNVGGDQGNSERLT